MVSLCIFQQILYIFKRGNPVYGYSKKWRLGEDFNPQKGPSSNNRNEYFILIF